MSRCPPRRWCLRAPCRADTHAGDTVALPNELLTAATLGLLASMGVGELAVRRRPRVAILSTGDEVQPPGTHLAPGQTDANGIALAAAITEGGGEPLALERAPDDPARVERQVLRGVAEADLLMASGAYRSGGTTLRDVIERLGTLDFWQRDPRAAGKPLAFGEVRGVPVTGLPATRSARSSPSSSSQRPLIRRMLGLSGGGRLTLPDDGRERMPKDEERRAYLRVQLARGADGTG